MNGTLNGQRFAVKEGGLRLGRSSSNDIHVPDEELSRNHCLFEPFGETGIRVTDLASANGTLVNGVALGGDPVELKLGDLIEVGKTVISVVGDQPLPSAGDVDLGLGLTAGQDPAPRHRSPLANVLWIVAVAVAGIAIYLTLATPQDSAETAPAVIVDETPVVQEVFYEKVEANLDGIFRYEMTVSPDGMIRVTLDDTRENRHPTIPAKQLDERARTELNDILPLKALREIDREYVGIEPDPPSLTSWRLKVVYTTAARTIRIANTQEPEAFRTIREKLEAFSKNELGIHAIQYPRAKLVELAGEAIAVGKTKWEDRDVQHGNLFGAVAAFKEALFYLETVDPKPACVGDARKGLEDAQSELERRYANQRFLADRAINLGQWETAQRELAVLLEMIPDRGDGRNREASAKLIDVEKRMKGGK